MDHHLKFETGHPALNTPCLWHDRKDRDQPPYCLLFRRTLDLSAIPSVKLFVSASQRYILYLNGTLLSRGPSRSDPQRWGVREVVIPDLPAGRHLLAAEVIHYGRHSGVGQMGGPGFFLCTSQGSAIVDSALQSGTGWKCLRQDSREWITKHAFDKPRYRAVGSGEAIDGKRVPWGWNTHNFDDSHWSEADIISQGAENPWGNQPIHHWLRPDPLPEMEMEKTTFTSPIVGPVAAEPQGPHLIPAQSSVRLVFDAEVLTNAYPSLVVSKGKDAKIQLITAEAPYDRDQPVKIHRNQGAEGRLFGHVDRFFPDGGMQREFTLSWFRSFRYLQLTIETQMEELWIEKVSYEATRFPLPLRATFQPDVSHKESDRLLQQVSHRTAQLCAHETFFDCPHFEQAQFPGDTRIQAIYHYLLSNEDRLAHKAIDDFHASRTPNTLLRSYFPADRYQTISTYSLYWIGMLNDWVLYRGKSPWIAPYLNQAREILQWFAARLRPDGVLGEVEQAAFIDWSPSFHAGAAPQDSDGGSIVLTMLFSQACGWMERLEQWSDSHHSSHYWREQKVALRKAALKAGWDSSKQWVADTANQKSFSLHGQVEAVLAGALDPPVARHALQSAIRASADSVAPPGTFYYRFYLIQALKKCGLQSQALEQLQHWHRCVEASGLTTWPETDRQATRSDCHGWAVAPGIELMETVLGLRPDPSQPGFARALFDPELGNRKGASGSLQTPAGTITVTLERESSATQCHIDSQVPLFLSRENREIPAGQHQIRL